MKQFYLATLSGLISLACFAEQSSENQQCAPSFTQSYHVERIAIDAQPVFDESAENTTWFHSWANSLHINTKEFVIKERLPFNEGDEINTSDIAEAEAILRRERYIANVQIEVENQCEDTANKTISVKTQDNWSFYPALSLSRSGGRTSGLIGITDANFLGLGVGARVRYTKDEQRTGYLLRLNSAVHWVRHANVTLDLQNNDDGGRYELVFNKPFYHLASDSMQFFQITKDERTQDIFQNGETRNSLDIDSEFFRVAYGWKLKSDELSTVRITAGFDHIKTRFDIAPESPSANPLFLAQDRQYQYPWLAFEYFQRDIIVMRDIQLINQPEDINLGWQHRIQFGLETNDIAPESKFGYHLNASSNRAFKINNWLLLFDTRLNAILNTSAKDFVRLSSRLEAFYRKSEVLGFYTRAFVDFSSGQFIDQPIVIDDDTGVRGYPLQYQHGDQRLSTSAEVRFYTNYNLYQLFSVGFAVFADAGRAYGGDRARFNEQDGILSSVGLGARFYSNKATNTGVLHLDFTLPLARGENVDTLAVSANLRRSF
jgi:outer membrane protein assembly factor BamA